MEFQYLKELFICDFSNGPFKKEVVKDGDRVLRREINGQFEVLFDFSQEDV